MTATTTATSVAPGGTEQICFSTVNTFVMPGDLLGTLPKLADDGSTVLTLILGEGLLQEQENLYATKAGILRHAASRKKPIHKYWIDSNHRRYVPHVEDMVVGIVASVGATQMTVDIGGAAPASLDNLAFEGASRKNRPNLKPGSLVYARVTLANKDMEPEVSCLSTSGKAEGFGALDDGYLFKVSLGYARELLHPSAPVLRELGKHFPYEIAVGMNGRVWIHSASIKRTILLATVILRAELLNEEQTVALVDAMLAAASS